MKAIFFHIFALVCLCGSATCGIFDDPKTVTKARCYANCITLVSQIPQNDSTCQSAECLQCKTPCDIPFSNLASCNNTCKSRFCEKSCKFLDAMSKWPSIYVGNTTIPAPGAPIVKTKNVSSLELSWQPSKASKGSVVYMLKVKYQGDYTNGPTPMENIVYLDSLASLTAKQACTKNRGQRRTYDGVTFKFSVVALTENSNLVESASGNAAFEKQDAVESVYNPLAYYERNDPGDDLRLQVTFKPSSALMGKNAQYLMITKAIPGPQIGLDLKTALLNTDKTANISLLIYEKITKMNISIKIYHMEECLPSKPKELVYLYRGCHYVSNYNKSLCCQFDPNEENSPLSTRKVSNLTYSPLQVTNDFQFNTTITWQPPTHSCPSVKGYALQYGDKNDVIKFPGGVFWRAVRKDTTKTYFNVPASINPGIEYQFKIQPLFLDDFQKDVGIKTTLVFKTPDVPLKDTSIKKIQRSVSSFSSSDFFVVNITWSRPVFKYSSITSYNVTYNMEGDPTKSNLTTNQWFVVRGLDFRQSLNYQVIPIYKHSWIIANTISGQPVKIVDPPKTSKSSKEVRNLTHSQIRTDADFRFRLNITWVRPSYPYYNVTTYQVSHGDANRKVAFVNLWWPEYNNDHFRGTSLEMENLLPNTKYKYMVKAIIPSVAAIEVFGSVDMPKLPTEELKVENVVPGSLGFSDAHSFSFNVTWSKPKFRYGNLVDYTVFSKAGNFTTNNDFHVVRGLHHSEPFTIQIRPNYAQKWIIGSILNVQLKGNDPNKTSLEVKTLREEHKADKVNDWFNFVMSWKPPSFQYKTIDYYQVSYSLSGYPYHTLDCKPGKVKNPSCGPSPTKNTTYKIDQVLPSEHIIFTVTPVFANSTYVKGSTKTVKIDAPYPRRNLVEVRNLTYIGIRQINGTKTMKFSWLKPQFRHSNATRYVVKYTIGPIGDNKAIPTIKRTRRSTGNQTNTGSITESVLTTIFSAPLLENDKQITLEVTPVFDVDIIVGEKSSITISNPSVPVKQLSTLNPIEIAGIAIGVFVFLLLVVVFLLWYLRRQKRIKDGVLVGGKGAVIDLWEVPVEKIYLEEELGEGAFGKVFKGILLELPEQSAKYSIAKSIRRKSLKPLNQEDGFVVAVKMLHDMADAEQTREFLKEIQLMKDVGSHRNIVNMLGCGTLSDPMFLIVEYLPNGDLLHYLRKRRGKATRYPDSDPRGPYHSTYCQTYFNKNKPEEGLLVQASRSDRIYVHSPENAKESSPGDIQLLSVQSVETGNNEVVTTGYDSEDCEKDDIDDDILTPGDLMAFAWQVSQGMEYLSKRGYVHRDLAARNVLVGNNKEAKIADFGLTRHMYENLYQAKTNRKLPLKWMSVEAIFDQSFTSQSDVWAYGVFLWELVTLGGTPYPSINNRELLKLLKEGYRMDKPETCDNELYEIMCSCWRALPEDRPTFEDLRSKLEEMMTRDNPYFDPSAVDESRDYYNVPSFNSAPEPDDDDDIIEDLFGGVASSKEDEIQIITKSNESDKNSEGDFLFSDVSPSGDPWVLELDNDASVNSDHVMGLDVDLIDNEQSKPSTEQPKTKLKNIKYASLDFNDIEFQIYRRQNRGFAL